MAEAPTARSAPTPVAPGADAPELAILFWCYKELGICLDRLRHIRASNPTIAIYVLFGGDAADAPAWEKALAPFVDDFYAFAGDPPPGYEQQDGYRGGVYWKYVYGDWMWASWYRDRGVDLRWDTVIIIQWDMLVFGDITETFGCLRKNQILLSGLRPVSEVEHAWVWVNSAFTDARRTYETFLAHVQEEYAYEGDPLCCLAIVVCLPRVFLEPFSKIPRPELGGLEYRIPIYADAFGVPFCWDNPFKPLWAAVERAGFDTTLRAGPVEIWAPTIWSNLRKPDGARVFHPYWRRTPRGFLSWAVALVDSLPRLALSTLSRRLFGNRRLKIQKPKAQTT